jgi:hypothetical protein
VELNSVVSHVIGHAFDLSSAIASLRFDLLRKSREIRFLDVIEKAGDSLIYERRVRQVFVPWIEEPA